MSSIVTLSVPGSRALISRPRADLADRVPWYLSLFARQCPVKCGSRFSANARSASAVSSVQEFAT
jgi:hypothetical protein